MPPNRFVTDRGFTWYDKFVDCYGMTVAVAESSSADGEHVWIHLDPDSTRGSSAHLDRAEALRVRAALDAWLNDHPADIAESPESPSYAEGGGS